MKKLNTKELKEFVTKEENVRLMQTLFEAIAFSETITAIVEKKANEILGFHKFETEEITLGERVIASEVILDQKNVYQLKQEDWDVYFKELESFYYSDECPVKPTKQGNCPALESQSLVRTLKREIADFLAPTLGINYGQISGSLKYYDTYYELIMKMFSSQIKGMTV